MSVTGGHLGAGLGVVELTVALHYVFDTPDDRLIWDVGHQAYPHKIVTGRRDRIRTLRQGGGLSGFTRRSESEYDPFGAAHSSTSISAALGFAIANKLSGDAGPGDRGDRRRRAVSAGMAYEAMNNAAAAGNRLIVILNDNDMSIAPPVGIAAQRARAAGQLEQISDAAQARAEARAGDARRRSTSRRARWRNIPAAGSPAARSSRSSASIMSGRSTGTTCARWSRCSRMSATPRSGRCWSMSSPRRARATRRPRTPPTNITAWSSSTSSRASRPRPRRARRATPASSPRRSTARWRATRRSSRSPRRCRRAPGSTRSPSNSPSARSTSALPSSMR